MSSNCPQFTGDKVKDAQILESNGTFQRWLSNKHGMCFRSECGITGSIPQQLMTMVTLPTAPAGGATPAELTEYENRLSTVQNINLKYLLLNNQIRGAREEIRTELCKSIENCPVILCTVDPTINIQTQTTMELYQILLLYLVLNPKDVTNLLKQLCQPFLPDVLSPHSLDELVIMHERNRNDIYTFALVRGTLFRVDEKSNHLKLSYEKFFAKAIATSHEHHADPSPQQTMLFISNTAKNMDREGTWRADKNKIKDANPSRKQKTQSIVGHMGQIHLTVHGKEIL